MNTKIEYARKCALEILMPSKKDLEHGLELHKNSIVFDSYGFSPSSPVDGDAVRKALEANASRNEIKDLKEEMAMTRHVFNEELRKEYLEAWEASGVTCVFQNAGEESNDPMQIIKRFARFTYVSDMLTDVLNRVVSPKDVEKTKKELKRCLYFTANAVPLLQQYTNPVEKLGYVRLFYQLGCRMMHMTYNRRNLIGDGCAETTNVGLSDFGEMVVKEMNRIGIICDVAHTGWQTCIDVAETSSVPVVSSHSACNSIKPHFRAKPDDVIKAIVKTGGYNGICCIPSFLGGKGDINALLDHIDYMVKKFGADYVTIGSDCGYSSEKSEAEYKKFEDLARGSRQGHEHLWPENSFCYDFDEKHTTSLSWTNWPLFTVGLVQRGHSDDDIRKIIGGNVMRVLNAVETNK
jgi:membrane dipeptidase